MVIGERHRPKVSGDSTTILIPLSNVLFEDVRGSVKVSSAGPLLRVGGEARLEEPEEAWVVSYRRTYKTSRDVVALGFEGNARYELEERDAKGVDVTLLAADSRSP